MFEWNCDKLTSQDTLKIEGKVKVRSFNFEIVGSTSSENSSNLFFNINNFSDNGSNYNSRGGSGRDNSANRSGFGCGESRDGGTQAQEGGNGVSDEGGKAEK